MPDALISIHGIKDLHDLASLFEVAIAYGTAYLALDFFKYRARLATILSDHVSAYIYNIRNDISNMPFHEAAQRTKQCFISLQVMPLWMRIIFDVNHSRDKYIILWLTFMNIISLVAVSFLPLSSSNIISIGIFSLPAVVSIGLASFFAHTINKTIKDFDITLVLTYETYHNALTAKSDSLEGFVAVNQCSMISAALQYLIEDKKKNYEAILIPQFQAASKSRDRAYFINRHAILRYLAKEKVFAIGSSGELSPNK